jgi:fumarate reductase flavoprotein subunit
LGGNSLAETVVMGQIVGETVAHDLEGDPRGLPLDLAEEAREAARERIAALARRGARGESAFALRAEMERALTEHVGIFRNGAGLKRAVDDLRELAAHAEHLGLRSSGKGANPELGAALRLPGQLRVALAIALGALRRTESRGSHFREDFPRRDDGAWLVRTLATWPAAADLPRLDYEPVRVTELPPGDRGYGEATAAAAPARPGGAA